MRKFFLKIFLFFPISVFPQDYIYKIDSSRIVAKVLEIYPYDVKYQLYKSSDTSIHFLDKEQIVLIVYNNGTYDMFSAKRKRKKIKNSFDSLSVNYGKNSISFNLFEIFLGNVSLGYERILLKGKLGIKAPLIFSYNYSSRSYNKYWAVGSELKFYPNGQGRARYFLGPAFEIGQYKYQRDYFTPQSTITEYRKYSIITLNNGVSFLVTPHLNISVECGIGMRDPVYRKRTEPVLKAAYNIGFRF